MKLALAVSLGTLALFHIGEAAFAQQAKNANIPVVHVSYTGKTTLASRDIGTRNGLNIDHGYFDPQHGQPIYTLELEGAVPNITLCKLSFEPLSTKELALVDTIAIGNKAITILKRNEGIARMDVKTHFHLSTVTKRKGQWSKLVSFGYSASNRKPVASSNLRTAGSQVFADSSVFRNGTWYKLGVTRTGVHRIDVALLRSLGISGNINAANIQLYGMGATQVPEANAVPRPNDIPQIPTLVRDLNSNGLLDGRDDILFYGRGPIQTDLRINERMQARASHLYSDTGYYYLTVGNSPGLRIQPAAIIAPDAGTPKYTNYHDFQLYERDNVNILSSGRDWFGEVFSVRPSQSFNFNINGAVKDSAIQVRTAAMVQAYLPNLSANPNQYSSQFIVNANGDELGKLVAPANYNINYGRHGVKVNGLYRYVSRDTNNVAISLTYDKMNVTSSTGYLDYIEIQALRKLQFVNDQFNFMNWNAARFQKGSFTLSYDFEPPTVWDIRNPQNPKAVAFDENVGNTVTFTTATVDFPRFIAFGSSGFPTPIALVRAGNQNLKSMAAPELLIITNGNLVEQANRLAKHRTDFSKIPTQVVLTKDIYQEFSSGSQDICGIRDFIRAMYMKGPTNSPKLKYVCFFGDASFDYKNKTPNNNNQVPTWESLESLDGINSYCSDDFFALLDENEGNWSDGGPTQFLDLGLGRITVSTAFEAENVVNKLITYDTLQTNMGAWRNELLFIADDKDNFSHISSAQNVAVPAENNYKDFNVNKLYLAAYPKVLLPSGEASPLAKLAIINYINQGSLITNYSGHGSEFVWTDERILDGQSIESFNNANRLSLFITATCDFGRNDNPNVTCGAKQLLIRPSAAGIGAISTNRPVFQNLNDILNRATMSALLTPASNGEMPRLGDAMRIGKNASAVSWTGAGNRGYMLFGDPSCKLAYPKERVVLTSINDNPVTTVVSIGNQQRLEIKGEVRNFAGTKLNDFNGVVRVLLKDKPVTYTVTEDNFTRSFTALDNLLFNGSASIRNGEFSLRFIVPKDISYLNGLGKLSFYAQRSNSLIDAHGFNTNLSIGGVAETQIPEDNDPPSIRLFMNDTLFLNGGIVSSNATFIAKLKDESGINLSQAGIGRELTGILTREPNNVLVMNNFYQSEPDDYTRGTVTYPLIDLAPGPHSIMFKAWDTYNNSNSAFLNFIVVGESREGAATVVDKLTPYPNPASSGKVYFTLEHNKAGLAAKVDLTVTDALGRKIFTCSSDYSNSPTRLGGFKDIYWDIDNSSNGAQSGLYFVKAVLTTSDGQQASATQKFVLAR